jgi:hypothetical protein
MSSGRSISAYARKARTAQRANSRPAQGNALGHLNGANPSPEVGGPNSPTLSAAHFGATLLTNRIPRALPWADIASARWAFSRIVYMVALVHSILSMTNVCGFESEIAALIENHCSDCHDADTKTSLDLEKLGFNLDNEQTFKAWEKVFDRVSKGEMPPPDKRQPDSATRDSALAALRQSLAESNAKTQARSGRVPVRRLTRTEYEYTMHDLLGIHANLARLLPAENDSAGYDTVATAQGVSPVHIGSYLDAADLALDEVMQLGRQPRHREKPMPFDYVNRPYIRMWFDRPLRNGGSTIKAEGYEVVTFEKRNHAMRSDHAGFRPDYPGLYRIEMTARAYQARTPVTIVIIKASDRAGGSEVVGFYDLMPGEPRRISLTTYFTPDHYFYPIPMDDDVPHPRAVGGVYAYGAEKYSGEGVALKDVTITGPLEEQWPPRRTKEFFAGIGLRHRNLIQQEWRQVWQPGGTEVRVYDFVLTRAPLVHLQDMVERIGPGAFRRPLREGEARAFAELAGPALEAGRGFDEAARVVFRALFSSPQFLFHAAEPGPLDDYALATRLSLFLWKSLPDDELFRLCAERRLTEPGTLAAQVDRMLNDPKSERFVRDFLDQWAGLKNIDATTPDDKLYPEYDDVLRQAMLKETRLFFRELIAENLPARNLIDSSFTFLNRRLAGHYGIPGVPDETFRRVALPRSRIRGGLLTQASVLKVTANGTVTSPVRRGAFVLTTLLGTAPDSPPPGIKSIEPDTRGTTTIRETLDQHRSTATCARCHRQIDPPGFALESFDPIGGHRTRYRSTGGGDVPDHSLRGRPVQDYRLGRYVDSSGQTEDGRHFADIRDYKRLLMSREEDVARNLFANLLVYATGGRIRFADRENVERIMGELKTDGYPVRSIIHSVVQSRMFRNK